MIRVGEVAEWGARTGLSVRCATCVAFGLSIAACASDARDPGHESIGTSSLALTTPVPSVAGLPGSYVETGDTNPMIDMTLGPLSQGTGTYSRTVCGSVCGIEQGTYEAMGNNPAIGFGAIVFEPGSGAIAVCQNPGSATGRHRCDRDHPASAPRAGPAGRSALPHGSHRQRAAHRRRARRGTPRVRRLAATALVPQLRNPS